MKLFKRNYLEYIFQMNIFQKSFLEVFYNRPLLGAFKKVSLKAYIWGYLYIFKFIFSYLKEMSGKM